MANKRRDDTSLSSLLGRKREINIEEIEKATQKVHKNKQEKGSDIPAPKKEPKEKAPNKLSQPKKKVADIIDEQVVRASIATPYELYLRAKRLQRKEGYRSLGAFYLHCVQTYLEKPTGKGNNYQAPDFSDKIDVSVSPDLELWTQIKLNQRKLGFKNMAGFYVFCLEKYLKAKA